MYIINASRAGYNSWKGKKKGTVASVHCSKAFPVVSPDFINLLKETCENTFVTLFTKVVFRAELRRENKKVGRGTYGS